MSAQLHSPPARQHGELIEIFPDIYLVSGAMSIEGRLPLSFSRNMTVIRDDGELSLVNSVRLDNTGLEQLETLGAVKHVIRLAGFHGMDDPFYKARYGASVWSVNAPYFRGVSFNTGSIEDYFKPDIIIDDKTNLPVKNSRVVHINSARPREILLYLARDGGIMISGDSLQNFQKPDQFFNLPAKIIMRMMGYIKPYNIGPGWLKFVRPDIDELKRVMDTNFEHLIPAHGFPVKHHAREKFRPAFSKL